MTDVLATERCPACAALVRPGQDWCTLCHTDLRPAPEPLSPPAPAVRAEPLADPLTAPLSEVAPEALPAEVPASAGAGKHARRTSSEATETPGPSESRPAPVSTNGPLEGVDVDAMLAELARQSGDPLLGGVSKQLSSRSAKAGLAIGLCLGLTLVLLVGSVILVTVFG